MGRVALIALTALDDESSPGAVQGVVRTLQHLLDGNIHESRHGVAGNDLVPDGQRSLPCVNLG